MVKNDYPIIQIGAPYWNAIEDDLIDTIALLYLQALTIVPETRVFRSSQTDLDTSREASADGMPSEYCSLIQASRYCVALMSPCFQFIGMATERTSYIDIQNQHFLCNRNGAEFAASLHAAYLSGATPEDILSSYNSYSELISSQKVLRARCLDPEFSATPTLVRSGSNFSQVSRYHR